MVGAFVEEVQRSYRWRAKRHLGLRSVELGHTGAVTFIRRFDSALRLNPHPHTLALDGVYVRGDDGQLDFHPLPAPSAEEVADVARRTAQRVGQLLEQRAEQQDGAGGVVGDYPTVATDRYGAVYVAWQENRNGPNTDIFFARAE